MVAAGCSARNQQGTGTITIGKLILFRKAPVNGDGAWLPPVESPDPSDGKLAHLDGLNLSRAWMLDGIATGLPHGDERLPAINAAAEDHRHAGLKAVTGEHYKAVTGWGASPSIW